MHIIHNRKQQTRQGSKFNAIQVDASGAGSVREQIRKQVESCLRKNYPEEADRILRDMVWEEGRPYKDGSKEFYFFPKDEKDDGCPLNRAPGPCLGFVGRMDASGNITIDNMCGG